MSGVRPKKYLGQHFLKDKNIAAKIVAALSGHREYKNVIEIGPGTGVLTEFLIKKNELNLLLVEIDEESVAYLKRRFPELRILLHDFLKMTQEELPEEPAAIIGNFPYNISSQIFFKILEHRNRTPEVVCMIQKEVAERISAPPGNKQYGILSVLLQAFYNIEYLFTVPPQVFLPPPAVHSAVVRLKRNDVERLDCDEAFFVRIVKQGFQTRRKTLRNALKGLNLPREVIQMKMLDLRAERLSVGDFVELTKEIQRNKRDH